MVFSVSVFAASSALRWPTVRFCHYFCLRSSKRSEFNTSRQAGRPLKSESARIRRVEKNNWLAIKSLQEWCLKIAGRSPEIRISQNQPPSGYGRELKWSKSDPFQVYWGVECLQNYSEQKKVALRFVFFFSSWRFSIYTRFFRQCLPPQLMGGPRTCPGAVRWLGWPLLQFESTISRSMVFLPCRDSVRDRQRCSSSGGDDSLRRATLRAIRPCPCFPAVRE